MGFKIKIDGKEYRVYIVDERIIIQGEDGIFDEWDLFIDELEFLAKVWDKVRDKVRRNGRMDT